MPDDIISVGPYFQLEQRERDIQFALYGPIPCMEFHDVRNRLLAVLRPFGTVGPMGEFSLQGDCDFLEDGDPRLGPVSHDPDYFVVDDQYNDRDRWHRVESDSSNLKPELLHNLISMLRQTNGWLVYFALGEGGLLVGAQYIGCEGKFANCVSVEDIEILCQPIQ
jgi:hypothetical protein